MLSRNVPPADTSSGSSQASFAGRPHISAVESPDAYVRKVMVNEHTTWWRRTWRHRERTDSELIRIMDPASVDAQRHDSDLWTHVRSLAPQQRAAVVLRYYEDLTEAQTAEAMGCSVGTVKSQVSTGLARLRDTLGDDDPDLLPQLAPATTRVVTR